MTTSLLRDRPTAPTERRQQEIAALGPWFYNLHLPDGAQTAPDHPLGDFPVYKWRQLAPWLPYDLGGWTALDIGCNAGFYSLELARRGAAVTAIDVEPLFLRQARWAAREFGLADRIAFRRTHVYDLAHEAGRYDLVLFMGVFYHLRYPLLGLDIVAEKVRKLLVFQTLTVPGNEIAGDTARDCDIMDRAAFSDPAWPKLAFIEHSFAGDPTNWWAANQAAVQALLRSAGMRVVLRPGHEVYLCVPEDGLTPWRADAGAAEFAAATGRSRRERGGSATND